MSDAIVSNSLIDSYAFVRMIRNPLEKYCNLKALD
jgi:hypothetical protein